MGLRKNYDGQIQKKRSHSGSGVHDCDQSRAGCAAWFWNNAWPAAPRSKSTEARLTSVGAGTKHNANAAAADKSYHDSVGPYLPLNVLWRIQTGGGDRTITADPTERDTYPLEGAIFYVPMKEHRALGAVPLYRLFNGNDHMVSLNLHDGAAEGYHVEEILGYPLVAQQPGTSELIRTYNPSTPSFSAKRYRTGN